MRTFNLEQCVGQILGDCYIEQLLSHGRLSAVYRGRQQNPNRSVALMVFLLPDVTSIKMRQQFCERFLQEAPVLMKISHPYLLPCYGYGEVDGFPYLITPYTTEGSLATRITQQGACSPASVLSLVEQVTTGMEYAHSKGLLHGMLSPANLLLHGGGSFQVAAIGLHNLFQNRGIVPHIEETANLCLPMVAAKYMAPEYRQEQTITIRSDIYSLGVILVEALSGSFLPKNTQNILSQLDQSIIPTSLQPVLQRALAQNPADRFRRMSDLFSTYAKLVPSEEQWAKKAQPMRVQTSPMRPAVETRRREAEYPMYLDRAAPFAPDMAGPERSSSPFNASFTPAAARSGRSSSPFSIPKLKNDMQRMGQRGKVRRRQVTAVLAGSVVLGLAGFGSVNLVQLLTARPQAQTQAAPAAPVKKGIGQTTQPVNSAIQFIDKSVPEFRQRLLIHLPNGNFVAYKQGCTHTGVLVDYHPDTHLLVCPAHGAIFDPAKNGSVVTGPTTIPLPKVAIHVMGDGTIALA